MPSDGAAVIAIVIFVIICTLFRLEKLVARITLSTGIALLIVTAVIFAIDSRQPIPPGTIITDKEPASSIAIYAYIFLVTGVLLILVERVKAWYKKRKNQH